MGIYGSNGDSDINMYRVFIVLTSCFEVQSKYTHRTHTKTKQKRSHASTVVLKLNVDTGTWRKKHMLAPSIPQMFAAIR